VAGVVKGKTAADGPWTENADMISMSASGAGFYLSRQCTPGKLLSLMVPMPLHMRSYDHDKKMYRVWGLVQHCQKETFEDGAVGYYVGVAFVGKDAPASYSRNADTTYRISGMNADGLWAVGETETQFISRKEPRFWRSIDVSIFVLDAEKRPVDVEKTVTENISEGGSSVITRLKIDAGDRVKFYSPEFDFTTLAVVRNRTIGRDDRPRISLEFVEARFPVAELHLSDSEKNS
jgi:hypothetical protein